MYSWTEYNIHSKQFQHWCIYRYFTSEHGIYYFEQVDIKPISVNVLICTLLNFFLTNCPWKCPLSKVILPIRASSCLIRSQEIEYPFILVLLIPFCRNVDYLSKIFNFFAVSLTVYFIYLFYFALIYWHKTYWHFVIFIKKTLSTENWVFFFLRFTTLVLAGWTQMDLLIKYDTNTLSCFLCHSVKNWLTFQFIYCFPLHGVNFIADKFIKNSVMRQSRSCTKWWNVLK